MPRTSVQKISDVTVIILFLTVIFGPPFKWMLFPDRSWSDKEKRVLTPFPRNPGDFSALLEFPKNFRSYYNDHFGFREVLIDRYQREMRRRFGQSGVRKVIGGKDGWYFYTGDDLLKDFRGLTPLKGQQLNAWKMDFLRKRDWLAEQGIRYLFVVIPNKQTMYPEYLPGFIQKAKGETRLEQLAKYLDKDTNVHILDLTHMLRKAKPTGRLYSKTDTHWNYYGAFLGYKEIMQQISRWFPREHFQYDFSFDRTLKEGLGGDLAVMLGLQGTVKELRPFPSKRKLCAQRMELSVKIENTPKSERSAPFVEGCRKANLRALVFRDSFLIPVVRFLSENFKQIIYVWKPYNQEITERLIQYFHPDVVIEERVERFCFRH